MYMIGDEYDSGETHVTMYRGKEYEIHYYHPGSDYTNGEFQEKDLTILRIVDLETMSHVAVKSPLGRTIIRNAIPTLLTEAKIEEEDLSDLEPDVTGFWRENS